MPDRVKVELRPGHAVSMPIAQAQAYVAGHPTAKIVGEEAKALEPAEDKALKPAAKKKAAGNATAPDVATPADPAD